MVPGTILLLPSFFLVRSIDSSTGQVYLAVTNYAYKVCQHVHAVNISKSCFLVKYREAHAPAAHVEPTTQI